MFGQKGIAIGVSDFKTLIENNYYYIDKTNFIEEVCKNVGQTLLFTRPRRFGKTLNMSMLKYFFDIENKEKNRNLFKGLYIENSLVMKEQGKYPVIYISFKDVKESTYDKAIIKITNLIKDLYDNFEYIRGNLNESNLINFDDIWLKRDNNNLENSLLNLSKYLKNYYKKEVILLIDEYDTPLVSAYKYGYYEEAKNFFSGLYSSALKDNSNLQIGVLTGIVRVVRAGIFSDLNNLNEHSILDKEYDEYFGFLEEEIEEALKYYKIDSKIEEVHSWYNGYKFGDVRVYNPWSILKFLSKKEFESYWIDTSENYLIKDILRFADKTTFEKLNKLLLGEKIQEEITGKSTLQDVLGIHDIWELLLFSGYLTIDEKVEKNTYFIKIPNNEVKEFFRDSFIEVAFGSNTIFKNMIKSLLDNKIDEFEKNLQDIMLRYMSFNDTSNLEKVYHSFILGLMIYLDGEYSVTSNQESGLGRYDMVIEPIVKNKVGYIFEFKTAKTEKELLAKAKEGLKQIEDKKYDTNMKRKDISKILIMGIAFCGKKVKVESKFI